MLFAFLLFARRRGERCRGRLSRQALRHGERARRLSRSARRQGADRLDLRALGIMEALPRWLVILVVSRDIMIVGGVMFSWLIGKPVGVKPHPVSKLNTAAQILLVGLVLGALGLGFDAGWALIVAMAIVAALTLASVAVYLREWVRHMGATASALKPPKPGMVAHDPRRRGPAMTLARQMTFWVADAGRRRGAAVDPARDPAALRRRDGARLSARSAGQPAGADGRQPRWPRRSRSSARSCSPSCS